MDVSSSKIDRSTSSPVRISLKVVVVFWASSFSICCFVFWGSFFLRLTMSTLFLSALSKAALLCFEQSFMCVSATELEIFSTVSSYFCKLITFFFQQTAIPTFHQARHSCLHHTLLSSLKWGLQWYLDPFWLGPEESSLYKLIIG